MDNFTVSKERNIFSAGNYIPYAAAVQLGGTNYRLTASGRQLEQDPKNTSQQTGSFLSVSSNYAQGVIDPDTGRKQGLGDLAKDLESLLAKAAKENRVIPVTFNIAGPRLNSEDDAKLVQEKHRELAVQIAKDHPGRFVYAINSKPGSSENILPNEFFDLMNFIDKLAHKEQMQYEFVNDCVCNLRGVAGKYQIQKGSNLVHLINGTGLNIALGNDLQAGGKFAEEINTESGHLSPQGLLPDLPFYTNYQEFLKSKKNSLTLEGFFAGGNLKESPYRGLRGMILYLRSLAPVRDAVKRNGDVDMRLALDALNHGYSTDQLIAIEDIQKSPLYELDVENLDNKKIITVANKNDKLAVRLVEVYSRNLAHALVATQREALKQANYFSYSGGWMQTLFDDVSSTKEIFQEEFKKLGVNAQVIDFEAQENMDGLIELNQNQAKRGYSDFMHDWQSKFSSFHS
ncbi:MAG: hypothetical protein LW817_03315 [Candidatus Caenarcaniphilales bacterium]|jgi:hypothetical protein|nr:hypothetical protein [Candidatus Caenarcaniphilales bacterium]